MLSYVIFIFCIVLTLAFINAPSKRQNQIIFILCFVCFLLTGLRWEFGGDWEVYYSYFQKINSFALDEGSFEYGWVILSFVVKKLCASYIVFQFLMAAIIFFLYTSKFQKNICCSSSVIHDIFCYNARWYRLCKKYYCDYNNYLFLYLCGRKALVRISYDGHFCGGYSYFSIYCISNILDLS